MKKIITILLTVLMCVFMVTTSLAATTRIEGNIPGTNEKYEYIESAQISIPESDWIFNFENVTAKVGYTEKTHSDFSRSEPIPTYRFTILGYEGGFSINNNAWIVCNWTAKEDFSFDGDLVYEANSFQSFLQLPDNSSKGYRTYEIAVHKTSEGSEDDNIVACVEIFFGEYVEFCSPNITPATNNLLLNDSYDTVDIESFIINNDESTDYQITSGAQTQWIENSTNAIKFVSNGEFDKFVGVEIDGELVDNSNYIASEGSTIIELKPSFLSSLNVGEHSLTIVFSDGEASTQFEIRKANSTQDVVIPNTDAGVNCAVVFLMAISSLACGLMVIKSNKTHS